MKGPTELKCHTDNAVGIIIPMTITPTVITTIITTHYIINGSSKTNKLKTCKHSPSPARQHHVNPFHTHITTSMKVLGNNLGIYEGQFQQSG